MLISTLLCASVWAGTPQGPAPAFTPVHLAQSQHPPAVSRPSAPPPLPLAGDHKVWVYGYLPYWVGGLDAVPWDHITHLAIFDVELNSDGSLSSTSRWTNIAADAVALAKPYGIKVHLTVTCFSESTMAAVLSSSSVRAKAISNLVSLVDSVDAHGVSVDFEGMDIAQKADLVTFVAELAARVDEVTVATPAVDWGGAYDYDQLAAASDGLFIMGYGYHWSGGDPGPGAPLYGGSPWSKYSLEWTLSDYQASGAPKDKIILGLPLYGHNWPTTDNSVPGTATSDASAVVMSEAITKGAAAGRLYESLTETPYAFPSSKSQLWYEDTESIRAKVAYGVDEGLLGVGFWALGYDALDAEFWTMMAEETRAEEVEDPDDTGLDDSGGGGLRARAGQDIVAYVGQTVIFNGRGSGGDPLSFEWRQIGGPDVSLRGADTEQARFTPEAAGTYVFELVVSDGDTRSAPDAVNVVVMTLPAGTCSSAPEVGLLPLALGLLLLRRRPYGQTTLLS